MSTGGENEPGNGLKILRGISGILVIILASVTLSGWITGVSQLIGIRSDYVPMAIMVSIFFVIYGIALLLGESIHKQKLLRHVFLAFLGFCSIYGLLQFTGSIIHKDLTLEYTLFPTSKKVANFPIGHMSPYSGFLFFISGIAIIINIVTEDRSVLRNISAGIASMVGLAGFIAGLGYLYGTPFLYSGNIIPLAFRTALSFFLMGLGIQFQSGNKTIFLRLVSGPTASARMLRFLIPLIISVFILEGVMDVVLTHIYKINEATVLASLTCFSVVLCVILIVKVTSEIFKSANKAEIERLKMNEELIRVNALQELILQNTSLGICLVENNVFRWTNSKFSELFHYPDKDLTGISIRTIFNSDENYKNLAGILAALHSGNIIDKPIQFTGPGGENSWYRFIGKGLYAGKTSDRSVWIVEDITERRSLRERMRLLSHTIESLSECVSITDDKDRIIFVNKTFRDTFGYNEDELKGKHISIIGSSNNDPALITSILPETIKGGWKGEIINRKKDGTEFPIYLTTSRVVDENGKVLALVGVSTDITRRRQAEMQLQEFSDKLKEANEAKDKLFSIIAHDLKSPLNTVLGFLDLLAEQYEDFSEEEKRTFILEIRNAASNTADLLNNLLAWSRTQTGGIKVNPAKADLAVIVERQIEILKNTADKKNITLLNNIDTGTIVWADNDMINTIFLNLIGNAIKFTRQRGTVIISSINKEIETEITVADNGVGLSPDQMKNIFKLNKSQSTPGTSNERGTGLGLLICREFTEQNNGRIRVESELGKGSSFMVTLPQVRGEDK